MVNREESKKIAYKASAVSVGLNTILSLGKLLAGVVAHSSAMITDGIHSASDVLSTFAVVLGVKLGSKAEDSDHEYGHERIEAVTALIIGVVLFLTALGMGYSGIHSLLNMDTVAIEEPGILALVAALVSIVVKEWMFWYTRDKAKKINSSAVMAMAWDHRSDALSSIGAFIGILGARMGYVILDPVASIIICFFVGKAAWDIFKDATDQLVDKSLSKEEEEKMIEVIKSIPGVQGIDSIKTRQFGPRAQVDVEISADNRISFDKAHQISETVKSAIEKDFPQVKNCMVHISPVSVVTALVPVH